MDSELRTNRIYRESISFECVVVCAVFFIILSGLVTVALNDQITQIFRPILIAFLLIRLAKNGSYTFTLRTIAVVAAGYCVLVLLLHDVINKDELFAAMAHALFLIMLSTVSGAAWNRREIKLIIFSCYIACFVCALMLFYCNPITDFSTANSAGLSLFGKHINRNLYAYTFELGTVLGLIYLLYGRNIPKLIVFLATMVIAYAMIYSQCRGAFFSAILACAIVYAYWLFTKKNTRPGQLLVWVLISAAILVAFYFILLNSEASRILDSESTSGRDVGINRAFDMYRESGLFEKIFGNGYTYERLHTDDLPAHLVYATFLVSAGIIGLSFIVLVFITTARRIKGGIPFALFAVGFARTFFEAMDYYVYIPLILALIIYNYQFYKKRNMEELFVH